jgi:CRP-like cAMP-binding protein
VDASAIPTANRLLAALPKAAYRRLLVDLDPTTLQSGESLLHPAGEGLRYAYFPVSTIVTLSYAHEEGKAMAQTWPVGREGVVGIALILGNPKTDYRVDVQMAGLAFRLPALAFLTEFKRAGAFQQLLLRYVFALVTQAAQIGVCNHSHSVEQRLCRFLSVGFDRVSGNELTFTHERIGVLLGARRESITQAASQLHSAGIISYKRGHIELVNRKKLQARSCACGAIIQRAFQSVFQQGSAEP